MTESAKELIDEKKIAWYAASLDAWYATRLEHDRSLLTLSAGGIGLLITLESTVGIRSLTAVICFPLAVLAFIVCVGAVLLIFKGNSDHLEKVVHGKEEHSFRLAVLDRIAICAFFAGVVLSSAVSFSGAIRSVENRVSNMKDGKETSVYAADSINGIHRMKPVEQISKSFNGAVNMAPVSQQGAGQPQTGSSQPEEVPAPAPGAPSSAKPK